MPTSPTRVDAHAVASSSTLDPNLLAPRDALYGTAVSAAWSARKRRERARSSDRRREGQFKKLLWFKQPFPDNYTDERTFLDHLQRNPRLQPYEFWSLMTDATVIVQHVASVAIFCCCFVAIYMERVSPISVVSWASLGTFLAWVLWDYWMVQEEARTTTNPTSVSHEKPQQPHDDVTASGEAEQAEDPSDGKEQPTAGHSPYPPNVDPVSSLSPRNQQRLATARSALLIYAALLGLSPILKSLTKSTTSDSIWALSTWLLFMNVAFFDYGSGSGAHLPASISTNSALMASTVLASRLPSTTHVFSLTLFSIEVFGLFPLFRRQLRAKSRNGSIALTVALVTTAGGAVFATLTGGGRGAWIAGVILGSIVTFLAMGICSWWLIGLQKYKNEIYGPWDPARPIIRRRWD
ncbi:phosphatidylinositol N-acetylglucosaminyltransferase [Paraphaeosphaeria sporulosa]|uniref:Phosphatidylinositol N-acetylglucosaminyltransferase n=1 Tax=Paraphaeosphaeria sporulosa TaxID=1460663 RepID=A0A177CSX6_9PLEO|nr:phosphatidylinositol N-acetylglucosaminyltransferase [Paraphaeosphaeria sporulosa]OAG10633.1 phosphatidylinositol N-acetylglucosaminyltransferase [Paraphaeosphaeria sporulosa]